MSYLDDYKARINVMGNSIAQERTNNTANFINANFKDSSFYKVVTIDGVQKDARIEDMTAIIRSNNFQTILNTNKYIILRPNDSANLGSLVEFDGLSWLMTDYNSNDSIFPKGKIEKCNNTFPIQTGETQTQVGTDSMGRPVYSTTPTYINLPCIASTQTYSIGNQQAINVVDGKLHVQLPYSSDFINNVKVGYKFTLPNDMFNNYQVQGIDMTQTLGSTGMIQVFAGKVV